MSTGFLERLVIENAHWIPFLDLPEVDCPTEDNDDELIMCGAANGVTALKPAMNETRPALFLFLAVTALGCGSSEGGVDREAPPCLAESVSAGWHSTWVTKPDHSVWMFGVGGGQTAENGPGQRVPAIAPPVRQDWIPADTIALDARSDRGCIIGADHRMACEIPPEVWTIPFFVDDVVHTWTGPWDPSPLYMAKGDSPSGVVAAMARPTRKKKTWAVT